MKLLGIVKRSVKWLVKGTPVIQTYVNVLSREDNTLFAGKNILITGGSSGIGYAIARKCVLWGGNICITGRDKNKLVKAQETLGGSCKIAVFDVGDWENLEKNFDECTKMFNGPLDIVVSNAGIFFEKDFTDYTMDDWNRMIDINLKGSYFLSQQVIKHFLDNHRRGNLLFITSARGIMSDSHIYGISKAGVNSLIQGLAKKYAQYGIRINGIAPGMTATGINGIDPSSDLYHESVVGKRVLRSEEIAEVASFLISDASICINGEIIACDEGNTIK